MADWEYAGPSVALSACPTWVWVNPRDNLRILDYLTCRWQTENTLVPLSHWVPVPTESGSTRETISGFRTILPADGWLRIRWSLCRTECLSHLGLGQPEGQSPDFALSYLQMADWEYAGPSVALSACPTWVWVNPRDNLRNMDYLTCRWQTENTLVPLSHRVPVPPGSGSTRGTISGFWTILPADGRLRICWSLCRTECLSHLGLGQPEGQSPDLGLSYLQMADWEYAGPSVALSACPTWVWVNPRDNLRILNCLANSLISSRLIPSTVVLSVELPTVSVERESINEPVHVISNNVAFWHV